MAHTLGKISNEQIRTVYTLGVDLFKLAYRFDLNPYLLEGALYSDTPLPPKVQDELHNALLSLVDDITHGAIIPDEGWG